MKREFFFRGRPLTCSLAFAASILVLLSRVIFASPEAAGQVAGLTDIKVSFKLDPRITRGMYMGDRWVSPPTFTAIQEGKEITVEARAEGLDAKGSPVDLSPEWIPTDPDRVAVSPGRGKEVKITVRSPGQSSLNVSSPGISMELFIKATYEGNAIKVEITHGQVLAEKQQQAKKDTMSQKEKVSYSLGYRAGSTMKNSSVDLDPDMYIRAFREGLAGNKAAMTVQEMGDTVSALRNEMKAKQAEKKNEFTKDLSENNKKEGEAFLTENARKDGVVTLSSGLQYKVIKKGTGKQPAKTDKVKVRYRGTLPNGAEFDSSFKRGQPAVFGVDKVIRGWTEALLLMKEGSKWMLWVPPHLAYGSRGTLRGKGGARSTIGPNQTLLLEVELISIQ